MGAICSKIKNLAGKDKPYHQAGVRKLTLLGMPAEIRILIFEQVLIRDGPIHVEIWLPPAPIQPALTATCKQVRSETLPILHRVNTFRFLKNVHIKFDETSFGIHKDCIKLLKKIELAKCRCGCYYVLDLRHGLSNYVLHYEKVHCDCKEENTLLDHLEDEPYGVESFKEHMGMYLDLVIRTNKDHRCYDLLAESTLKGVLRKLL